MNTISLSILLSVDPSAVERARRLDMAMRLLQDGEDTRKISGALMRQFAISRWTARRITSMAVDLVQAK